MRFLENLRHYQRVTAGMRAYLRTPLRQDSTAAIREQLQRREDAWLELVKRGVFDHPGSVYGQLFEIAGCTYRDVEAAVHKDGLETALRALRDAGVYLTHDEFKEHVPIVRAGRTVAVGKRAFANPLVAGWLDTRSSGSRSAGTKSSHNTELTLYREGCWALHFEDLGIRERVSFPVRPVLPAAAGLVTVIAYARLGCPMRGWFALGGAMNESAHYRALTNYIVTLCRLRGLLVPFPTHLDPGDFAPVAAAIVAAKKRGEKCAVQAVATIGVRIVEAALRNGWDISGSLFILSGEPVAAAKRQYVESAGVEVRTMYWISEVGPVGWSCSQSHGDDSVHLMRDSVAVISHEHRDALSGAVVRPLLFTTLLPFASNLLINADMGDCAELNSASCDCVYTKHGLNEKVGAIWSYAKLTGQGMTLAGTDVIDLLESKLPAQFGGVPGDYQLVEEERSGGTCLVMRVHPRVGVRSRSAVRDAFLRELRGYYGGSLASRVWQHTDAVEVVELEPITTSTGKTPSLHLLTQRSALKEQSTPP